MRFLALSLCKAHGPWNVPRPALVPTCPRFGPDHCWGVGTGDIWASCPFSGDLALSEAAQGCQGGWGPTFPMPTALGYGPDSRISWEMLVPWASPALGVTGRRRPQSPHSGPQGAESLGSPESEAGSVPLAPLGGYRGPGAALGLAADLPGQGLPALLRPEPQDLVHSRCL